MSTMIDNRAVSDARDCLTSIPQAWAPFSKTLDVVLSKLEKDQYLIISAKGSDRFVQFACQGEDGMRVEVTSNHFLKGKERLSRRQVSWLLANGWSAPTGDVKEATPERDPNGSPNYFIDLPATVATRDMARLATEALVRGLGIQDSVSLAYEAFEENGRPLRFEGFGLDPAILGSSRLMELVLEVFRRVTGISDLELDSDGDVTVLYRDLFLYATPLVGTVRFLAALVTGVVESPALLRRLNDLNTGPHAARCVLCGDRVFASMDVLATPFVSEHIEQAIKDFSQTVETFARQLRDEFSDEVSSSPLHTNYIQ